MVQTTTTSSSLSLMYQSCVPAPVLPVVPPVAVLGSLVISLVAYARSTRCTMTRHASEAVPDQCMHWADSAKSPCPGAFAGACAARCRVGQSRDQLGGTCLQSMLHHRQPWISTCKPSEGEDKVQFLAAAGWAAGPVLEMHACSSKQLTASLTASLTLPASTSICIHALHAPMTVMARCFVALWCS